jgi:hypothetical protein
VPPKKILPLNEPCQASQSYERLQLTTAISNRDGKTQLPRARFRCALPGGSTEFITFCGTGTSGQSTGPGAVP